jgi:hypothetical protein
VIFLAILSGRACRSARRTAAGHAKMGRQDAGLAWSRTDAELAGPLLILRRASSSSLGSGVARPGRFLWWDRPHG